MSITSLAATTLPDPKGLEFIYHGDHIEVVRKDGRTQTPKDMAIRDAWFNYLKKKAELIQHRSM